jgi:hypothetical protein
MQQPLYIYDLRYVQGKGFDAKICAPQCPVSWWVRDMHLEKCKKKYIFVHYGYIPSRVSNVRILLRWYTLSSLFTALTHSVCIVLTLRCTDSLSVYCPHSPLC